MLDSLWGQWLTVIYMAVGTMYAVVFLMPKLIAASEALRNHLGRTTWNYLFVFGGVMFAAWTVFVAWMLFEERQQGREILDRLLPLFDQLTPEEPPDPGGQSL